MFLVFPNCGGSTGFCRTGFFLASPALLAIWPLIFVSEEGLLSSPDFFKSNKSSLYAGHTRLQLGPTKQQNNGLETLKQHRLHSGKPTSHARVACFFISGFILLSV
jgi:hypothetical protein